MNLSENVKKNMIPNVNAKAIIRYAMVPDIMPRIRGLGMHFGHFAYLIALVFNSARLIPMGHPVLNPVNIGRFGVRQVVAIAANHIQWSRRNIDQIGIFVAVVTGVILIVAQVFIIALYAFSGAASAQTTSPDSFFTTPEENVPTDVVLIFLEQIFGPNLDLFGTASEPTGTPVYEGLQAVLKLYSMATMVIAVIIVLYYILTVIGEAAQTGRPFGGRFNSLWAPIRLVIALGLLVPLASGLNSAQYITLWVAKMGSGLGTQVWTVFAEHMTSANKVISKPASASTIELVTRVFMNEVCAASYNQVEENNGRQITVLQSLGSTSQAANFSSATAMVNAAKNAGMDSVDISWSKNTAGSPADDYTCGHMSVSLADFDFFSDEGITEQRDDTFWEWLWGGRDLTNKIGTVHESLRSSYISQIGMISDSVKDQASKIAEYTISINPKAGKDKEATIAGIGSALQAVALSTHEAINTQINVTYQSITSSTFARSDAYADMINRGWGAAGLWYGNIAKINQKYMDAINAAAPTSGAVFNADAIENSSTKRVWTGWFGISNERFGVSGDAISEIERALSTADGFAQNIASGVAPNSPLYQDARLMSAHQGGEKGVAQVILYILGGNQLYNLKNNPTLDPMARLAGAGHTIVNHSLTLFFVGAAASVGSLAKALPSPVSKIMGAISGAAASLCFALATIGLVAGVFLAYVIPFMPFIYFSFAVIGWVLEIFEAIVAMPLWALAHLRIDGEGMPGQAAIGGYQLLLMVLLRPGMIVLGLIGGYVVFGAAMYFFSTLYNAATTITQQDITGSSQGWVGVFVFTILYAFLAYNIATMCFKMIDDVPKGIMRWMGSSAQPFSDSRPDPMGASREMAIGVVGGISVLRSGLQGAKAEVHEGIKTHVDNRGAPPPPSGGGKGAGDGSHRGISPEGRSYSYGNTYGGASGEPQKPNEQNPVKGMSTKGSATGSMSSTKWGSSDDGDKGKK